MIDEYTYSELMDMHIMFVRAYRSTLQVRHLYQELFLAAEFQLCRRNGVFERVKGSLMRRAAACVTAQGGHLQHLL
jgi:hypothetical protein